jgi:capsular exopolysaccharide synthesis family protein
MSQIFNALQRLEREQCESGLPAPEEVTDLLRRSERRVVSMQGTADVAGHEPTEDPDHGERLGKAKIALVPSKPELLPVESSLPDQCAVSVDQFESLGISLSPESRLPCITQVGSPAAEAFRLLGVRLQHLRRTRPLKRVLITSTLPQEGKSMVSANLACSLTMKTQQRTLLLEGDMRRPSLSKMFGLARKSGLTEWLDTGSSLATSIYHLEGLNIWLLPAGTAPSNALVLLQSGKIPKLMDQLTELFDWVVIDSPPILPIADTSIWMRLADGILLVTRRGFTERKELRKGLDAIESSKLIGALVNGSDNVTRSGYYYYGSAATSPQADVSLG